MTEARALRGGQPAAAALARPASGRVVATHRRAINLWLDDGPLVALLPPSTPVHPWALTVEPWPLEINEGVEVRSAGPVLKVGPVVIEMGAVEVVDLRLHGRPARLSAAAVDSIARLVESTPLPPAASDLQLAGALRQFAAGGGPEVLAGLVGLGEGLTPSGDDALIGVLAGLDLAGRLNSAAAALRAALVEQIVVPAADRTTRLSAQLMTAAAEGLYAEPLLRLLEALADAPPAAQLGADAVATGPVKNPGCAGHLELAITAVAAMGHRSGLDTLRGLAGVLKRS